MLGLPEKPWKAVRIQRQGDRLLLLRVVSELVEAEFEELKEEVSGALSAGEELRRVDTKEQLMELEVAEYEAFLKKLVYLGLIVEE
jgi:hypothetical protein